MGTLATVRRMASSRSSVLARGRTGPLARAATMIEFALVIPIFLFMLLFSVDMGMMMLTAGGVSDAAYSAARAGAQVGGTALNADSGSFPCEGSSTCWDSHSAGASVLKESLEQVPIGGEFFSFDKNTATFPSGRRCQEHSADAYVKVTVPYEVRLMTPGLATLIGFTGLGEQGGKITLTATGVARCELYR